MEEKIIRETEAFYFESALKLIEGYLVLTNKRIFYSGKQMKVKFNHGAIGNIVRDKMAEAMGYGEPEEEHIFEFPLAEITPSLKRQGFGKRLVITDKNNHEFKLTLRVPKAELNQWVSYIDEAKKTLVK